MYIVILTKQKQQRNREKVTNIQNLWVVTNLSIFCKNFGITLHAYMDFMWYAQTTVCEKSQY